MILPTPALDRGACGTYCALPLPDAATSDHLSTLGGEPVEQVRR